MYLGQTGPEAEMSNRFSKK